jgi:hypothetical protein
MVTGWSPRMRDNRQSSCNMVNQTLPVPLYFATQRDRASFAQGCAAFEIDNGAAVKTRAGCCRSIQTDQTSTCFAMAKASSTSMPRYLTVLSIFV